MKSYFFFLPFPLYIYNTNIMWNLISIPNPIDLSNTIQINPFIILSWSLLKIRPWIVIFVCGRTFSYSSTCVCEFEGLNFTLCWKFNTNPLLCDSPFCDSIENVLVWDINFWDRYLFIFCFIKLEYAIEQQYHWLLKGIPNPVTP